MSLTTEQQRTKQFQETTKKLNDTIKELEGILELIPIRGNDRSTCKQINLQCQIEEIKYCISGLKVTDFETNEFSGIFFYT